MLHSAVNKFWREVNGAQFDESIQMSLVGFIRCELALSENLAYSSHVEALDGKVAYSRCATF